jgi:hypothetical protein
MKHYELYSWSAQYRQERLAEAGRLRLEEKLRASREARAAQPAQSLAKSRRLATCHLGTGRSAGRGNPCQLTPRRGLPTTPGTHGGQ